MRKSFKLEDLDCANCAAKMQDAISKMPGVETCTVNFMMQKMTLVADDARFDDPTASSSSSSRIQAADPLSFKAAPHREAHHP